MLKEKIVYKDELPINVVTANITEYPIHFHDDMEVVYVLIHILSSRETYSFSMTGKCTVSSVQTRIIS